MIIDMKPRSPARLTLLLGLLSGLMATTAPNLLAAERQTPGQYELTVTTDGKSHTSSYCVTSEDAKAVNADAKTGRYYAAKAAKGACSVTSYEVKGETISFTLACGDSGRTSNVAYHGDSFEGDTTYTFMAQGKRSVRVSHLKAKRVGACK